MVEVEEEMVGHRVTTDLHKLVGVPTVSAFQGNSDKLRNWLVSIGKRQLKGYNAALGAVSEFIGDHLARDPQLRWTEL